MVSGAPTDVSEDVRNSNLPRVRESATILAATKDSHRPLPLVGETLARRLAARRRSRAGSIHPLPTMRSQVVDIAKTGGGLIGSVMRPIRFGGPTQIARALTTTAGQLGPTDRMLVSR